MSVEDEMTGEEEGEEWKKERGFEGNENVKLKGEGEREPREIARPLEED